MQGLSNLWGEEPVLILGLVQAGIALVCAFGINLTNVQTGCILAFSAAVLAVITRTQVTPSGVANTPVPPAPPAAGK